MEIIDRLLGVCYSIRISLAYVCLPAMFVPNLLSKCEALVACEHQEEGKRTHIHFALFNSSLGHDSLRKYLNHLLSDSTNLTGNSLLSVKAWDLRDRYLIYIIKGKNPFIINRAKDLDHGPVISDPEYERLKSMWVSQSSQENEYTAWKASPFFPQPRIFTMEQHMAAIKPLVALEFEDIRLAALQYVLHVNKSRFVEASVRYIAKDLISNYCLFNNFKMQPVYI